jgi:hypothetical protein
LAEAELDLAQLAVASLRRLQAADHALVLAVGIVDDELDRGDALGRAMGSCATSTRKLDQLCAKLVIYGLVESNADHAALAPRQPDPLVESDHHMHASADQLASAVRAPNAPVASGRRARGVYGYWCAAAGERLSARAGCDTHVPPLLDGCGQAHVRAPGGRFVTLRSGGELPVGNRRT